MIERFHLESSNHVEFSMLFLGFSSSILLLSIFSQVFTELFISEDLFSDFISFFSIEFVFSDSSLFEISSFLVLLSFLIIISFFIVFFVKEYILLSSGENKFIVSFSFKS